MPPALDPDKRARILDAIRAGAGTRSAGSIAREHHVARSTVTKLAHDHNLDGAFERAQTEKATAARQADVAAVLVDQASRNLGVSARILESFEAMDVEAWKDVAPYSRGILLGILQDKAMALAPRDEGVSAAVDALTGLGAAIQEAYRRQQAS